MTPTDQGTLPSGGLQSIISWFARNHVAANLLMLAVVVTGLLVSQNIRQEIYPTFTLDVVEITMDYRGASPEDIEQSIILPIESELRSMEIIREITQHMRTFIQKSIDMLVNVRAASIHK